MARNKSEKHVEPRKIYHPRLQWHELSLEQHGPPADGRWRMKVVIMRGGTRSKTWVFLSRQEAVKAFNEVPDRFWFLHDGTLGAPPSAFS